MPAVRANEIFEDHQSYQVGRFSETMAQYKEFAKDDRQLVDYLLGVLPEEELERLDEASIVDDDVAARLCDVENDLIDAT